jgi:hypothetical protein
MADGNRPATTRGPGGIGRWVWWYVIAMLVATAAFAVFTAFN